MAQTIKLKRSSTEGKIPTTSQLALGEIAINTFDGRIFFEKNDGSATIEQILTTDSITTGSITITGSLQTDNITIDNATISSDLDITLDSAGDIILDADGTDIILKDGGTEFGRFKRDSSNFVIKSATSDKDIIFKGVDNSSTISALTLNMSEAGAASFNSTISATGATLTNLSSEDEATSVMINDLNQLVTRELGSNAFTSTTITPDGGNADTVDSLHASSFLRSDAVDSAGSKITFSGGLNIPDSTNLEVGTGADFVINDNGSSTFIQSKRHAGEVYFQNENASGTNQNTLILGTDTGNTSATYAELRYNNVERIKTTTDGSDMAGLVNFNGTTQSTSKTTGTVVIDGGVGIAKTLNVGEDVVAYASSDERYKDLITPIENPNEKIKLLSGNTFVWNDKHEVFKGKKDIGVIAQEVEKVLPEIVETRDNGYKAVKYEKIVALLIESNKELLKRVEELESKIK